MLGEIPALLEDGRVALRIDQRVWELRDAVWMVNNTSGNVLAGKTRRLPVGPTLRASKNSTTTASGRNAIEPRVDKIAFIAIGSSKQSTKRRRGQRARAEAVGREIGIRQI